MKYTLHFGAVLNHTACVWHTWKCGKTILLFFGCRFIRGLLWLLSESLTEILKSVNSCILNIPKALNNHNNLWFLNCKQFFFFMWWYVRCCSYSFVNSHRTQKMHATHANCRDDCWIDILSVVLCFILFMIYLVMRKPVTRNSHKLQSVFIACNI